ncbi:MAG: ASPIC/UnbV domain-containing protein [Lentisphaeria bacterium]
MTSCYKSGSSCRSQNDLGIHLGLGECDTIDRMDVFWSSCLVEHFEDLPATGAW